MKYMDQPSAAHFLGATEGSNNIGELIVRMEDILYLLGNSDPLPLIIAFFHDNQWAANMTRGNSDIIRV